MLKEAAVMHAEGTARRIWIAGTAVDVWDNPQASFSWTPGAIQGYARTERWASLFNALVLLGDSDPRGEA
jgi:hypothetical protein